MAFVSFHAIDEFPGMSSIPFLYDGLHSFPAASGGKISKVASVAGSSAATGIPGSLVPI
jgi:hypothetical protein